MNKGDNNTAVFKIVELAQSMSSTRVKAVGVGGAGCNTIHYFAQQPLDGVDLLSIDTDAQSLLNVTTGAKVQLGTGRGTGSDPAKGKQMVTDEAESISGLLEGADIVFIFAGMGGGTGTGGAPMIADIAAKTGALTVAVVTRPFAYENRDEIALEGIKDLRCSVDAMMTLSNQRLIKLCTHKPLEEAFNEIHEVLYGAVRGIWEIATVPGVINVDFEDVRAVIQNAGVTLIGTGIGSGEDAVKTAVQSAINNPLLDEALPGQVKGMLCNLTVPKDFSVDAMQLVGDTLQKIAAPGCRPIWGVVYDPSMKDEIRVTVVASVISGDASESVTDTGAHLGLTKQPVVETSKSLLATKNKEIDYDAPAFTRRQLD